jgi:hypothetical protein
MDARGIARVTRCDVRDDLFATCPDRASSIAHRADRGNTRAATSLAGGDDDGIPASGVGREGEHQEAQRAARAKRTITKLPTSVRRDLGRQAAKSRQRGGVPGHALEDRTRQDLYEVAKKKNISGRSSMGKWELIRAIRKAN